MSDFEENIQQWVSLDNQVKVLNENLRELREKKIHISEKLTGYAETNKLSNATIQISDGKLKFTNARVAEPLTFKYLEKSLSGMIRNESQVKQIIEHVKQNREIKLVREIKRFS